MGGDRSGFEGMGRQVEVLAQSAKDAAAGL
jgi:hypothetical protein